MTSYAHVAQHVRLRKERQSHLYCPIRGCLWLVHRPDGSISPCRKHPMTQPVVEPDPGESITDGSKEVDDRPSLLLEYDDPACWYDDEGLDVDSRPRTVGTPGAAGSVSGLNDSIDDTDTPLGTIPPNQYRKARQ